MNEPRDHFLAGAGLALQKDRHLGGGDPDGGGDHGLPGRRRANRARELRHGVLPRISTPFDHVRELDTIGRSSVEYEGIDADAASRVYSLKSSRLFIRAQGRAPAAARRSWYRARAAGRTRSARRRGTIGTSPRRSA